jgi:hypothetical protein
MIEWESDMRLRSGGTIAAVRPDYKCRIRLTRPTRLALPHGNSRGDHRQDVFPVGHLDVVDVVGHLLERVG